MFLHIAVYTEWNEYVCVYIHNFMLYTEIYLESI